MLHLDKEKFRVGMRTTKSGIAVGLCVLLFKLLDRGSPMLAGLAAVFALREDCKQSFHHGIRRVGGNTVAGILGVTLIAVKDLLGLDFSVDLFGTIIAIIILITVCNILDLSTAIVGATATFLVVFYNIEDTEKVAYAVQRVLDTVIGTSIAIGVNHLLPGTDQTPSEN
ncbi:FUSC family protein [Trichococcus ilyis]|uniref:Aromatic acid exporter family member 1 n=1 Tax=Trichococcus ilyis TaxID=640938 RepID=A0A143YAL2_9LACT|nr:aromatic acid exporter family protein [Trichococcus ilyis]CZQ84480.1 Hypothetical protein TR210_361 [Trichococcus ilyis]SEJ60571.1 Aromatic acid exporter family member 1 [Trichococcus ilyis]